MVMVKLLGMIKLRFSEKQAGGFFQILWPSNIILTLLKLKVYYTTNYDVLTGFRF